MANEKKELATIEQTKEIAIDFKAKAIEYLESMGTKLPKKYMSQFLELASAFQLNPFKREIYAVGYGDNYNIITGFEVYLKRAERSGKLDGWETEESGSVEKGDLKSTITIYRTDRQHPFKHTVYYKECVNKNSSGKPNAIWSKMPIYMTKKVAMAQGFRLCFPDELSGMPYTNDEMLEIEKPDDEKNSQKKQGNSVKKAEQTEQQNEKPKLYPPITQEQNERLKAIFSNGTFEDWEIDEYRNQCRKRQRDIEELIQEVVAISKRRLEADTVETAEPDTEQKQQPTLEMLAEAGLINKASDMELDAGASEAFDRGASESSDEFDIF